MKNDLKLVFWKRVGDSVGIDRGYWSSWAKVVEALQENNKSSLTCQF